MSNARPSIAAAKTPADVRAHLVNALDADLVGPFDPTAPEEVLPRPPSRWYLTGFLAPEARRVIEVNEDEAAAPEDVESEEELAAGPDDVTSSPDESKPKRRMLLPASVGLSVLLPGDVDRIAVDVSWADYVPELEDESAGLTDSAADSSADAARAPRPSRPWRRIPRQADGLALSLQRPGGRLRFDASGLELEYQLSSTSGPGLPEGTQALSLFLVNRRPPLEGAEAEQAFMFQVSLGLSLPPGKELIARPNHRGEQSDDEDERTADLQYRAECEWAVGHGIAAERLRDPTSGRVTGARTVWIPRATVPLVQTKEDLGSEVLLGMEALAGASGGAQLRAGLGGLATRYQAWIETERKKAEVLSGRRQVTARKLVRQAERAHDRIVEGVELLASNEEVRLAFCLANRAMADQARQRTTYADGKVPTWRPFQLAFLLLSLPGIADDQHGDREVVELIFFPTGGGKTEAYLGLAAMVLILRRLRGSGHAHGGLGLAVLLRYTLRLLTLDQLGRAATLICAIERLRQKDPARLGSVRFSLGLWVGKAATANDIKGLKERLEEYRDRPGDGIPCPLTVCPWCQTPLGRASMDIRDEGVRFPEVRLGCVSTTGACPFTLADSEGLPVIFVDEQLYRELPGFVIATVDKLAMLPFKGETSALFGRVAARDGRAFINLMDPPGEAPKGDRLPDGLRPPDLIIQDELHLISGPLGTMVGLYEMAVDGLCSRPGPAGRPIRPKVVASTATVRRARQQITALFGRTPAPAMFPPAGMDAGDSFFGQQEKRGHGRLYLGVAAPGRAAKAVLLRIYVALLTAAERARQTGPEGATLADAYMTLVGYFNSLRELGGMRRLVEDEVRTRCEKQRLPLNHVGASPWFATRELEPEPLELTSRESTERITEAKRRLEERHGRQDAVDIALASNMISVGVDVPRLGLMVVAGQPKTTSEYIQATSRVGRDRNRPGLVVVAFNTYRPRDRSHYEHFAAYHDAFYANVEATSVTPFSAPALERGLAGALVALTRLGDPALVPPLGAAELQQHLDRRDEVIAIIAERARTCAAIDGAVGDADARAEELRQRARVLFDSWDRVVAGAKEGQQPKVYSRFDSGCHKRQSLLRTRLDEETVEHDADEARFAAPTSMRDVEAPVPLWITRRSLGKAEDRHGKPEE